MTPAQITNSSPLPVINNNPLMFLHMFIAAFIMPSITQCPIVNSPCSSCPTIHPSIMPRISRSFRTFCSGLLERFVTFNLSVRTLPLLLAQLKTPFPLLWSLTLKNEKNASVSAANFTVCCFGAEYDSVWFVILKCFSLSSMFELSYNTVKSCGRLPLQKRRGSAQSFINIMNATSTTRMISHRDYFPSLPSHTTSARHTIDRGPNTFKTLSVLFFL